MPALFHKLQTTGEPGIDRLPLYAITAAAFLAAFGPSLWLALNWLPATLHQSAFHPMGYDSFYHAARILDIAADPTSLYEFDQKIHAPEGSWLTWPWAYDYLIGALLSLAEPQHQGRWLASVPLIILSANCLTFALIAVKLLQDRWLVVAACLAYGVSPLTLNLHGAGMLDHHNVEHWFWMTTLLTVMAWQANPASRRLAIACGVLTGLASAFHNGLFIIQLPLVLFLIAQRAFGTPMPWRSCTTAALALVSTQLLVLLPTSAWLNGTYQFHTLSWFHLHAATITALTLLLLSTRPRAWWRDLLLLGGLALLALPLATEFAHGLSFVSADFPELTQVTETQSPFGLTASSALAPVQATSLYSGLLWLWPVSFGFALWCVIFEPRFRAFSIWACIGLALLATQYRLFYFGFSFLILLPALLACRMLAPVRARAYLGALLVALYTPCYWILSSTPKPGMDARYTSAIPVITTLSEACEQAPGIVLATPSWGHILRYATDCSVIANYFIMTPQHAEKIARVSELMQLPSTQITRQPEPIRYVFVSAEASSALSQELLDRTPDQWVNMAETKGMLERPVIRLFRIDEDG